MLLTVCTINQLPQALALGRSFTHHNPRRQFVIGLADDAARLPANWSSPYPMLTLADAGLSAGEVSAMSARYTPTEFRAACKPAFIRAAFKQAGPDGLLYADPSAFVYHSLDDLFAQVAQRSILLNPHWLEAPGDNRQPDEKHLQNVGLYSGGLVGFGPQPDTDRMLAWWQSRTADRAHLDFCTGQCLDQLWLMHVPALFSQVGILKNIGLQVALWNLPERHLANAPATGWQVIENRIAMPLLTADFLGLTNVDEGLFPYQNRLQVNRRPDVSTLLADYQTALAPHRRPDLLTAPAYGQQPEPIPLRGWRWSVQHRLQRLSNWIENVPVRPVHR